MSLDDIINEVLEHLYEGYIEHHGTPTFGVDDIISAHGKDPSEVGHYLADRGLVKFPSFGPKGFHAAISMDGILRVKPEYVQENKDKIIGTLGLQGNPRSSIMELLDFPPEDFQRAFDLAKEFEAEGLIEAQYTHNDVIVKLTLEGEDYYDQNKADFV
jgi:hypothetical protein